MFYSYCFINRHFLSITFALDNMMQIRFVLSLVLSLIFSIATNQRKNNFFFGVILLLCAYGVMATCIYFYIFFFNLLVAYFLRNKKWKKHVVLVTSLLSSLMCSYYYKVIISSKKHNICGPIMVLVIKLYYLAKELDFDSAYYHEVFDYVFCAPNIIAGPACSMSKFEKNRIDVVDYKIAIRKLVESLLYLAIHLLITNNITPLLLLDSEVFFPLKICYLILFGFGFKCQYYFIWNFTEACFQFNGFKNMANIKPIESELSPDMRVLARSWNIYTNIWLKDSVFDELKNKSKFLAATCTFMTSALWHGPKLGYFFLFVGFLFGKLVIESNNAILSRFLPENIVYCIGVFQTNIAVNYLIIPFSLLEVSLVHRVWYDLYYCVHLWLLFSLFGLFFTRRKKENGSRFYPTEQRKKRSI